MKIFVKLFHRDIRSNKSNDYFFIHDDAYASSHDEARQKIKKVDGIFLRKRDFRHSDVG